VGHHLVAAARRRDWPVTVFNHDPVPPPVPGISWRRGDRDRTDGLRAVVGECWDLVVDTWAGPPLAVKRSVQTVAGRTTRYCYVSSVVADTAAAVPGDGYGSRKRMAEEFVGEYAPAGLIVRLGLVLGPREFPGRLPYWLRRLAEPRPVLAPGRPERPVRYVDVRDAAEAILDAAALGASGIHSLTSTPASAITMGALLAASASAVDRMLPITWVADDILLRSGASPWTDIPLWIPENGIDFDAYSQESDLLPLRAGYSPADSVAATWQWMTRQGGQVDSRNWLSLAREAELLELAAGFSNGSMSREGEDRE
jgi:2'-hydroxyisoflavone reductase